jgi:hypothetical protein
MEDRFHLGSDTKAFTFPAGQPVRGGRQTAWDSTLAEIFPELNDKMDSEFAKITPQEFAHSMTRSWPQKLLHRN